MRSEAGSNKPMPLALEAKFTWFRASRHGVSATWSRWQAICSITQEERVMEKASSLAVVAAIAALSLTNVGCATKKHVREAIAPVQNQVNDVQKQAQDTQKQTQENRQAIGDLDRQVASADEKAADAGKRAGAAAEAAA